MFIIIIIIIIIIVTVNKDTCTKKIITECIYLDKFIIT